MDNEARRLSPRGMALYSVAAIGGGFFYIFNNAVLPLLIPSSNVLLVNLMSNTRSIEGAVIQPVVGAWSDRLWTRLGRRRPFMLSAMPLCALVMALTPLAPNLTTDVSIMLQQQVAAKKASGTSGSEAVKEVATDFLKSKGLL